MATSEKIENKESVELEAKIEKIVGKISKLHGKLEDFENEGLGDPDLIKIIKETDEKNVALFDRYAEGEISEKILEEFEKFYKELAANMEVVFGPINEGAGESQEKDKSEKADEEILKAAYEEAFNSLLSEDKVLEEAKSVLVKKGGGLNKKEYDKVSAVLMNLKDEVFEMVRKRNGKEAGDKEYVKKIFVEIVINSGAVSWAAREQKMEPTAAKKIEQLIKNMTRHKTEEKTTSAPETEKNADPGIVEEELATNKTEDAESPVAQDTAVVKAERKDTKPSSATKAMERQYLWKDQIEKSIYAANNRKELLDYLKTLKEVRLRVSQKDKNNKNISELRKFRFPDYINKVIMPVLEGKKNVNGIPIKSLENKLKEILNTERAEKSKKEKAIELAAKPAVAEIVPEKEVMKEKPGAVATKPVEEVNAEPIAESIIPKIKEEVVAGVVEEPKPEVAPDSVKEPKVEEQKVVENKNNREEKEKEEKLSNYIESYQAATEKFLNLILDKKIIKLTGSSDEDRMADLKGKLSNFIKQGLEKSELKDKKDIDFIIDKVINKIFS